MADEILYRSPMFARRVRALLAGHDASDEESVRVELVAADPISDSPGDT